MSDHPKISIISTVYNTGPYLRPAVESILAQTFTDFELLLVDDGSHDGSAAVCDALAQEDARIRVFHQPNGGPAHARNTGLDNARGDYIGMVDSDDLIEPTMFATLYSAVQVDGVRLAACAGDCIDADGKKIEGRMVTIRQGGVRDAQELLLEAFQTGSFYGPLSWNKLFDARLFKEKGIHYDETMLFGDDASVLHRVFEGERCNCLTDVLYHYRTRAGQITTGFSWKFYAVCDLDTAARFDGLSTVKISVPGKQNTPLSATVEEVTEDKDNGIAKIVLQCQTISAEVLGLGCETVQVDLKTYEGIRIDKAALHIVNGQRGVYVKYGNLQRFLKITTLYENDSYILVPEDGKLGSANEVRLYDEIIVQGTNLEDGKLL